MHTTLRQSSLPFTSKRSTPTTAAGKAESSKSFPTTPVASIPHTPEPRAVAAVEAIDLEDDSEPAVESIEISDSDDDYEPTSKRGKALRRAKKADDIEDADTPPAKRRRVPSRVAQVKEAVEPVDESDALAVKGKGKRRAPAKKSLGKSVFRSREGVENSDREGGKSTPSDWKITVKGNQDTPGHVNRQELLRHFGEVREKMGNVKPIHADTQTMEDHILRVFDLSYEYGPCIGVTRLQRWERAEALGMNPPPVVKQLLTSADGSEQANVKECVFSGEV